MDNQRQNKIKATSDTIKSIWLQNPELRLGQLIDNAIPVDKDIFYVTDDDLVKYLKEYTKNVIRP